jgi:Cu/Ag efflux pump CusA
MVMSQSGRNDSSMDPFGPNRNEFLIQPYPYSTWQSHKTKRDLVQELDQRLNTHIPGATFNITQPIIDTSTEIATGSSADLAVIITPDVSILRRLAGEVLDVVRQVAGAAIPMGPFAHYFKLQALPRAYFPILVAILLGYMTLTQLMKGFYARRFGWQ